jgi:hypothetical protein
MKSFAHSANSMSGIQLAEYAVTAAVALISILGVLRFLGLMH